MRLDRILFLLVLIVGLPSAGRAADKLTPAQLAQKIDKLLAVDWKHADIQPAPVVDDATFLRRATLDLVGRIPTTAEARDFLADTSNTKRAKLIERLIDSAAHTRHMATFWRRTWLPQADTPEFARLADDFEMWLSVRIRENTPLSQVVDELLTVSETTTATRGTITPAGFFAASENKPENLAANAMRAFLGVNLDCAQCHDHPFARWTRDQFWQTAAFFAPPKKDQTGKAALPELTIPNTKRMLKPELLDGGAVAWPEQLLADTGRRQLSSWIIAKNNPYFAKNAVNRLWANVFGTALVEPLDDLSGNTNQHPELLNELAQAFTDNGNDLKYLTRAFVQTKAYQLAAVGPGTTPSDPKLFARIPVRGLTGEQLYDSLRIAAGLPPERDDVRQGSRRDARKQFASQFHVQRPSAAERSITQALSLMNGRVTNDLTLVENNPTLAGIVNAPFLNPKEKIETLFLAVLGRKPSEREALALLEYVEKNHTDNSAKAFGDLFWAFINSTEFNTNH